MADWFADNAPPAQTGNYVTPSVSGGLPKGMLAKGTVDLSKRPNIDNGDGTHSSVFSMGVNVDGKELLVPGVGDGKTYPLRKLSVREAVDQYKRTGQHLGVFASPEDSDAYASTLHEDQARGNKAPATQAAPSHDWFAANAPKPEPGMLEPHHDWTDPIRGAAAGVKQLVMHPIDSMVGMPNLGGMPGVAFGKAGEAAQQAQTQGVQQNAQAVRSMVQDTKAAAQDHPAFLAGQIAGPALLTHGISKLGPDIPGALGKAYDAAPTVAGRAVTAVGETAQDAGTRLLNNTVGTLKADFKRGANPGRGYLETGHGTSLSMQSLADKSATALQETGKKLGTAYQEATASGAKIPVQVVMDRMAKPIQKAISLETGPGGTGNVSAIQSYVQQFEPAFAKAAQNGGFTPSELFEMKRAIAANTNWSDPAQFSLKSVRQQQTGALSGILSDAVPETRQLNQTFQDLTKLTNRATERANTGSRPLTAHIYKAGMTTVGALAGGMDGHPLLGAAVGTVMDSVPAKTALASGLFRGGRALAGLGERLSAGGPVVPEDIAPNDLGGNGANYKPSYPQLAPPGPPELAANQNSNMRGLPAGYSPQSLPASTAGFAPTTASPPPPLNAATARMRVQPNAPASPDGIPSRGPITVSPSGEAALAAKGLPAPANAPTAKPLSGKALWAQRGTQNLAAHGVSASELDALTKTTKGKDLLVIASGLTPGSVAMKNLIRQIKTLTAK